MPTRTVTFTREYERGEEFHEVEFTARVYIAPSHTGSCAEDCDDGEAEVEVIEWELISRIGEDGDLPIGDEQYELSPMEVEAAEGQAIEEAGECDDDD